MSSKKIQLFILPFAGGSAAAFTELSSLLAEWIEVYVIEYPGRGSRLSEPFCDTMEDLIEDSKKQIETLRKAELPFALMGYSIGVEVSFDLAQYALDEKPEYVFFAAREAIHYDTAGHDYVLLKEDDFQKKIIDFGGIDERVIKNKRFLNIYMRPVHADYKLLNQYIYKKEKGKLGCDMTVFYCEKDTPYEKVKEWETHTEGEIDYFELGENHFFIRKYAREMAEIINQKLRLFRIGEMNENMMEDCQE